MESNRDDSICTRRKGFEQFNNKKTDSDCTPSIANLFYLPSKVTLNHYEKLRVIGRGAFGKVHAVSRRDTKELFAMKVLDKNQIIQDKMTSNVLNERNILAELDYPLVVNIRCAVQTALDLFLVVDLMQGGDIRYHMRGDRPFTMERIKFYAAQTALAINYVHSKGYIHRDIKPDNLLFDGNGNVHLTDFNLSIRIKDAKFKGVGGTRPYMAPEMLSKHSYGHQVDWWSYGVMVYEWATRSLPFSGSGDAQRDAILHTEPRYPSGLDKDLVDFLRGLLKKDPRKRFGFTEIQNHPWLKGTDWVGLENKSVPTPWQPDQKKANCDGSYDLDEQFEVKKKRFPLPPEQEALFQHWDWIPGQDSSPSPPISARKTKNEEKKSNGVKSPADKPKAKEETSDDVQEESSEPPVERKPNTTAKKTETKSSDNKKGSDSPAAARPKKPAPKPVKPVASSSEESSEANAPVVTKSKKQAAKPVKKETSSEEESTDEDSPTEESSESSEEEATKEDSPLEETEPSSEESSSPPPPKKQRKK